MKEKLMILWVLLIPPLTSLAQKNYVIRSHDGVNLQVNEYGQGAPVILLAGGPGFNAAYLEPIWKALPDYRFIVPDQRGTGHSSMSKIDSGQMLVDNYVEDLELLRKHLNQNKIVFVGHSWGAMLAFAYAAKYPENVNRLILLGPGGVTKDFFSYFNSNIKMRLREDDLAEAKEGKTLANNLKAIWPGYFFNRESALATKKLVDTNLANHNAAKINRFTLNDYNKTSASRAESLRRFRAPVYVIQGRQDPVGESTAYETRRIMPQTQIFFIEKCGHLPWLENEVTAARFYELIRASLH
ncbi:proline iminopeptidase [Mucilaginibacter sp. SG538B]|uniref:alpha/beta fold hydrolase n=1 Tax=Mucilaginibacter sp. SG538B TaxID=2587021 RepID=UPI00159E6F2A|nr:alpha/beta hydrolase [Mucilaginibacter sp. SG538B]NVM66746.1 proline iminopeptidase [Mucilaginibacter sp. SG538B]